jgi:hypothetical protein
MKTTTVDFVNFAQDAMTLTEMNFLRGGGNPDKQAEDLIVPPKGLRYS